MARQALRAGGKIPVTGCSGTTMVTSSPGEIHTSSCRVIKCTRLLLVEIYTVTRPLIVIMSCADHPAQWIWEIRRMFPGHTGVRTWRINGNEG